MKLALRILISAFASFIFLSLSRLVPRPLPSSSSFLVPRLGASKKTTHTSRREQRNPTLRNRIKMKKFNELTPVLQQQLILQIKTRVRSVLPLFSYPNPNPDRDPIPSEWIYNDEKIREILSLLNSSYEVREDSKEHSLSFSRTIELFEDQRLYCRVRAFEKGDEIPYVGMQLSRFLKKHSCIRKKEFPELVDDEEKMAVTFADIANQMGLCELRMVGLNPDGTRRNYQVEF